MTPAELHNIFRTEAGFWWYQGMRALTRALLEPVLTGHIRTGLDAGCGSGYNALEFQSRYGLRMVGVDLAPLAIQYCRKRNFDRSLVASVMELPFPGSCFDVVSSFDVLSHLPPGEDDPALRECVRVLRPGGWLVLRVPAFQALRSKHSEWIAEQHRYRARELRRKLLAVNCPVVRSTYANMLLAPLALLKFRVWEAIRQENPHSGVGKLPPDWLNCFLLSVLRFEAALIGWGFAFPFGQSLVVVAQKPKSAQTSEDILEAGSNERK